VDLLRGRGRAGTQAGQGPSLSEADYAHLITAAHHALDAPLIVSHTARTLDELEAIVRRRLRQIQRRPELISALLGQTGLILEPP
jgi:hypothetical protein